ncbi:hypothetical protein [Rubellimicrobium aerolatum]|uniref:hypothetical protein n=1 Tax=Rubellimicrobium aerolatum TaxID=490979 RepID=UPI001AE45031|nr:hypothetical protein [Rubellimicrobium aerolatum]
MKYTAGNAAKATGKSIPTITRAIKKGVISAEKTASGGYLIDPAELHRVFPAITSNRDVTPDKLDSETPLKSNVTGELELEVRMLREMLSREQDTVTDLRARLDAEAEERRRLTLLLTHHPEKPSPTPALEPGPAPQLQPSTKPPRSRSWWQRLRGVEA